ncbi:hypothetical protein CS063_01995 [Sporanaerobium hydrogeniformans]|uniref:Uncharacterized protein n=1 Tax=Sporanaerobium hydrogeniformans TaxID=3072179 RepID=A0AC61DGF0_9FIRM|nr:tetratricopeptide repeat protein [Sporanaerobium hydrogeniformans]PHV72271.1 hypothetical protein CS063_01995 [Sporanaerobium hydrogeniformans]
MKILFVNIPWMKYYVGEGDEESLPPLCGYNFQNVDGYYYGYGEGLEELAIEEIEGVTATDQLVEDVLVIWTAKNREGENKIIGWYKKATVYRHKQRELTLDSDRPVMTYTIKAKSENGLLLPPELRLLAIKDFVEGPYFEKEEQVIKDVAMYTHNYAGDKMNFLLDPKDLTAESVLQFGELEMYFSKADEFLAKDLYGKAMRCFNKAISLAPEVAATYEFKGSILLSLKMYKEALQVYKQVVALEEDNEEAAYILGLLQGLTGNYKAAAQALDDYISQNPRDNNALAERGIIAYHLGEEEKAKEYFARVYQKECDNEMFRALIAFAAGV